MNAQQLKNSILQMAIQGKLVPQDPSDEPASVLLECIREEKEQLIKAGEIKHDKHESIICRKDGSYYETVEGLEQCIDDEIPFDIPEDWELARLKNVSNIMGGYAFKSTEYVDTGIRVIRISDFDENGLINKDPKFYKEQASLHNYMLRDYDILICMTGGTVGKTCILGSISNKKLYLNQRVACIRFNSLHIVPKYAFFVLNSPFIKSIINASVTSTNDNISMSTLNNLYFPVPPLNEQRRIVEKIEEILSLIEKYGESETLLDKIHSNFPDQLKKSILQLAVQGKLVAQDPTDEPTSTLLERIHKEKEQLIKAGKIKRDKNESVICRKGNSYYETVDGVEQCIDEEIPFDIPDTWKWTRFSNICSIINGDRGKNYPAKSKLTTTGIPFISALNLTGNTISADDNLLCLSDNQYNKLRTGKLCKGDIIICIRGSLGKHGIYPFKKGAIASSLVIARPVSTATLISYIIIYLDTPLFFQEIKKYDNGTAQPNLAAGNLEKFLFPIPPIEEQQRIVGKVEELLTLIKMF